MFYFSMSVKRRIYRNSKSQPNHNQNHNQSYNPNLNPLRRLSCRMVLSEREDLDMMLEFASLCRHGDNHALAERMLQSSFRAVSAAGGGGSLSQFSQPPASSEEVCMEYRVRFAMLKQRWAVGQQASALAGLDSLIRSLVPTGNEPRATADARTHHDCLLRLGEWKVAMVGPGMSVDPSTRKDVMGLFSRATLILPSSYRAWHQWGLCNYRAIEEARGNNARGHHRVAKPSETAGTGWDADGARSSMRSSSSSSAGGSSSSPRSPQHGHRVSRQVCV